MKTMAITTTQKENMLVIKSIAVRARKLAINYQPDFRSTLLEIMMDIEYFHELNPIDLVGLINADDYDFCHDVFGIVRHFNRNTLKLEGCFFPRYSLGKLRANQ
jgi:hypothetical protein